MAAEYTNSLAGLLQLNSKNVAEFEVSDLLQDAPLLNALYAQPASQNTVHQYLKETVAAGVAFRAVNAGVANAASKDLLVEVTLAILDASFNRDKALAIGYRKGRDAYMGHELVRSIQAAFAAAEAQLINGTNADASGFSGLRNAAAIDALADAMVVSATGTAGGTFKSSAYLIRSGESDVSVVAGQDGNIDVGDVFEFQKTDPNDITKTITALGVNVLGWLGLQLGGAYSIARICNITDETGKGLTDALLSQAFELFPGSRPPTHILMHRKARGQLQRSRTAFNNNGEYAKLPVDWEGIPFIVSDGVSTTEAIVT